MITFSNNHFFIRTYKDCSLPGWSSATNICFRIVHFQKDFWSAKQFCKLQRGLLLQLKHVPEVLDALGQSMWGNAGEYRLDGWANGTWYHLDNQVLDPKEAAEGTGADVIGSFTGKTLTVDLQTGMVAATADEEKRLGFICQGDGQPCAKEDEQQEQGEEEEEEEEEQMQG